MERVVKFFTKEFDRHGSSKEVAQVLNDSVGEEINSFAKEFDMFPVSVGMGPKPGATTLVIGVVFEKEG